MRRAWVLAALVPFTPLACSEVVVVGDLGADAAVEASGLVDAGGGLPDGAQDGSCVSNQDCPGAASFCGKPQGQCYGPGTCTPRPLTCAPDASPVCDCTASDRVNACEAARQGNNVDYTGYCARPKYDGGLTTDGTPGD